MVLPRKFLRSAEGAIASYDWTDVAEGTGIVTFYPAQKIEGAGTLSQILVDSNTIYSATGITDGNADRDFDLSPFNLPKVIKGTVYFNFGMFVNTGETVTITCQLRKWDGATETALHTAVTRTQAGPSIAMWLMSAELTQTSFKKGDILRVNVTMTGGTAASYFGVDPVGRDISGLTSAAGTTTTFSVLVPFRVDI